MADGQHGGYRQPANPAVVSGPGAGSARTDGGMGTGGVLNPNSPQYGEGATLESLKAGAPMASGGGGGGAPQGGAPVDPIAALTALGAPSQLPDMPVTAGAASGEGPGVDVLGLPQTPADQDRADVAALPPGLVKMLIRRAESADATPSFRQVVRKVLANQ